MQSAQLGERIARLSEAIWAADQWRAEAFSQHKQTDSVVFRFSSGDLPTEFESAPHWEIWKPIVGPILSQAASFFEYPNPEFCRILLARLNPGGKIAPHVDCHPTHSVCHRIHVPIVTNPLVAFSVAEVDYQLKEGVAYEVNNLMTHSVVNNGKSCRIHLIADLFAADS